MLNFLWIAHYAQTHGSVLPSEYFEAGTISMIYAFVGILVWILVNNLRANEAELARNLLILRQTQEKLLREEKLAAVGRLSSAIAHEIRNPVAMISSSLATAIRGQLEPAQRERMFEIASIQAARLEKLTNDFLSYAKPRTPAITHNNAADVLAYVAELSKAHAGERQSGNQGRFLRRTLLRFRRYSIAASTAESGDECHRCIAAEFYSDHDRASFRRRSLYRCKEHWTGN